MKFKTACLTAALATAGLAATGVANAQSSVTLYGIVDVAIEHYNNAPEGATGGSKSVTGMRSGGRSGSRWGLRGVEDLGGGLQAVFQLESGFNVGSGRAADSTRLFNRTAMVGLKSSQWGQLSFGRQYTSGFIMMSPYVPGAYGSLYEPSGRMLPSRADNSVVYAHRFGGLNVGAYYSFRDQGLQVNNDLSVTNGWGAALGYTFTKGLRAMVAYDRLEQATGDGHNAFIGGRWDVNNFVVLGGYRYRKEENAGTGGNDRRSDMYMLGLGYHMSPAARVLLTYHHEKFKNAATGYLGTTDDTWKQVVLLAEYSMSKRTDLYATVAYAKDGPLNLGYAGDGGNGYVLADGKSSQTGIAVGMRHRF